MCESWRKNDEAGGIRRAAGAPLGQEAWASGGGDAP